MHMSIQIHTLPAHKTETVLPYLFEILYENMDPIDPSPEPFEDTCTCWCRVIGQALEDTRRTMLVLYDGETIIGFFMYAVNRETGLFLMEEIQLRAAYHGSGLFHRIYNEVLPSLPQEITTVEAYAHKKNLRSQGILQHLGLSVIGENKSGNSHRYRGNYTEFVRRMNQNHQK